MVSEASPSILFQQLLEQVTLDSGTISDYMRGDNVPRPWMLPPLRGWDGNLFNLEDIALAFDRNEANESYQEALFRGGSSGHAAGQKMQIDYQGGMERAFRERHKSPVRAAMHAAGRRRAHGDPGGVHIGGVLLCIQEMLRSGLRQEDTA